jgi:hypothetical protein
MKSGMAAGDSASSATAAGDGLRSIKEATGWVNSRPLTASDLHGQVVLIGFCSYTCISWIRSLPYLRAWADKYSGHGLAVIGVHTPEFRFERDIDNVRRAARDMMVPYPIAIDNSSVIWQAFGNRCCPALYAIDVRGHLRHHHFGEGEYGQSEMVVHHLLAEAGFGGVSEDLVSVDPRGIEAAADWDSLRSPENYVGYERAENFASPGGMVLDASRDYASPERLALNQWALSGDWTAGSEAVGLNEPGGRIACRFHARDLHLVMRPAIPEMPVRFRVVLDGQAPGAAHGIDVDDNGEGVVAAQRLYQLIRQRGRVSEHTFEIEFLDPCAMAYAFTFG